MDTDSFQVIDRHGTRSYRDDQVVGIACHVTKEYQNGTHSGNRRRCKLWVSEGPSPIQLDNIFKLNDPDPLAEFLDRLLDLLREGSLAAWEHGVPIAGDGWELHRDEIRTNGTPGNVDRISLSEVAAVELHDGKLGIWTRGQDLPSMQFAPDERNVWLLHSLLNERLQKQDGENAAPIPEGSLGRILFQRRTAKSVVATLYLVGAAGLLVGLLLTIFAERDLRLVGVGAIPFRALFLFLGYFCATAVFRAHEVGVYKASIFGGRTLRYRDVAAFTYSSIRHYYNGAYTGTALSLAFEPKPNCGKSVSYSTTVRGDDADLDNLRDFIARVIAVDMFVRWNSNEEVPWTDNITYCHNGIRYRPSGVFTRKAAEFLPFEMYAGWNMSDGHFYMFEKGKDKPVMSEATSVKNFFPGFMVLMRLLHSESAEESSTTEA